IQMVPGTYLAPKICTWHRKYCIATTPYLLYKINMPRKPRQHVPNAFYHVYNRGINKQNIFQDHQDRRIMYRYIGDSIDKYDSKIHAFCLMANHYHLLAQTGDIPLGKFIHHFSSRYTRYFNKKYGRSGYLFESRYKGIILDKEGYLLTLMRYIHLNPVRAKLVESPEDYQWSSHNLYLNKSFLSWLTMNEIIEHFGKNNFKTKFLNFVMDSKSIITDTEKFYID
ncbi:MAG: hypothetical protein COB66_07785, partial [Coxiella sp. (in: Bacteria)]